MPASSIAQILLRLFALEWIVASVIQIFYYRISGSDGGFHWLSYLPLFLWLIAGLLLWGAAPAISRLAANGGFTLAGVTERMLYATAFLGLGLFFALKSFASVFTWIHHYALRNRLTEYDEALMPSPGSYSLAESIITFAAGITLVLTCRILARKMTPGEKPQPAMQTGE
jgi:hypothetical protein